MSDTNTETGDPDDPETTQINLRLTEAFLDDIDATWREEGFRNRSDFIRWALRDAVAHPGLSRASWKQIAAAEHDLRTGDATTLSREEVLERMEEQRTEQGPAE